MSAIFVAVLAAGILGPPPPASRPELSDAPVEDLAVVDAGAVHQRLLASNPAAGEALEQPPEEVRLEFAEPVQLPFTQISLTGPGGDIPLAGPLRLVEGEPNVLVATLPPIAPGPYTVSWRTASADGHPVTGSIPFTVSGDDLQTATEDAADDAEGSATQTAGIPAEPPAPAVGAEEAGGFGVDSPFFVAVRWGTFAGTLGLLGAAAFYWLVVGPLRRRRAASREALHAAVGAAVRVGAAAAALLLVSAVARLAAQMYALTGEFAAKSLGSVLFGTLWGWGWRLQFGAAAVAGIGFLLAARSSVGWLVALAGVAGAAVAPALSGHAVVAPGNAAWAVAADTAHVLAAGGWVGGLVLLLVAGLPAALRHGGEGRARDATAFVNAFSVTALVFAAIAVLTGFASASIHIGSPADLWTSAYGRTLRAKLAALALLFGLGAYNFLRVRPSLDRGGPAGRLRITGSLEIAAAVIVLLVTAVLVGTPPPDAELAANPPAAAAPRIPSVRSPWTQ